MCVFVWMEKKKKSDGGDAWVICCHFLASLKISSFDVTLFYTLPGRLISEMRPVAVFASMTYAGPWWCVLSAVSVCG